MIMPFGYIADTVGRRTAMLVNLTGLSLSSLWVLFVST